VGGILTNSLALLTDAWHMLNHIFALVFALVAAWLALRPISVKRTYGYYRAEILAAFLNGIFLWAVAVFIFYQAIQRIQQPAEVESENMLIIAVLGLIANVLTATTLSRSKDESLNVKGACGRRHPRLDRSNFRRANHGFHRMVPGRPFNQHDDRRTDFL